MTKTIESSATEETLHLVVNTERLDAVSASDLKNEFEAVWFSHFQNIHVDMAKVEFIDSSGVGVLLVLAKKLPPNTSKVRLIRLKKTVKMVLEVLRLTKIFEIRNS